MAEFRLLRKDRDEKLYRIAKCIRKAYLARRTFLRNMALGRLNEFGAKLRQFAYEFNTHELNKRDIIIRADIEKLQQFARAEKLRLNTLVDIFKGLCSDRRLPPLNKPATAYIPATYIIYAELRQLCHKLSLDFVEDELHVTSPAITLKDVELGKFIMTLRLRDLESNHCNLYIKSAQEPQPEHCCHPHAEKTGLVTLGRNYRTIFREWQAGYLFHMFEILVDILQQYDPATAVCTLEQLDKVQSDDDKLQTCECCGRSHSSKLIEFKKCDICGRTVCAACIQSCSHMQYCNDCVVVLTEKCKTAPCYGGPGCTAWTNAPCVVCGKLFSNKDLLACPGTQHICSDCAQTLIREDIPCDNCGYVNAPSCPLMKEDYTSLFDTLQREEISLG